jgi:hypothetical protein
MPLYGGLMPLLILGTSIANTFIITVLSRCAVLFGATLVKKGKTAYLFYSVMLHR